MKVDNLAQLKKLILLCRKTGVDHIKVDNIEMSISLMPTAPKRAQALDLDPMANISVPTPNLQEGLPTPANAVREEAQRIATQGLTEEQLLMWSVNNGPEVQ